MSGFSTGFTCLQEIPSCDQVLKAQAYLGPGWLGLVSLPEPPLSRPQDRAMINQRQKQKQAEKCNQLGKGMAGLWQSAFLLGPLADWTQGGREIVQMRVPGMRPRPAEAHPGQRVTRSHNCTQTHTSVLVYAHHFQPKGLHTCPHLLRDLRPSLPAHSLGTCRCTVQTRSMCI